MYWIRYYVVKLIIKHNNTIENYSYEYIVLYLVVRY